MVFNDYECHFILRLYILTIRKIPITNIHDTIYNIAWRKFVGVSGLAITKLGGNGFFIYINIRVYIRI
jgi:hypothetical protein